MNTPHSSDPNQDSTAPSGADEPRPDAAEPSEPAPTPAETAPAGPAAPGEPAAGGGPGDDAGAPAEAESAAEAEDVSFERLLTAFEEEHSLTAAPGAPIEGTVIEVRPSGVFVDLGLKREGLLPLSEVAGEDGEPTVKAGDKVTVSITGQAPDGYFHLSTVQAERPRDWSALEKAYREGLPVAGTVTGVIKGGLTVDVGARAFMPASRSGTRDAAEMEALVGQEIRCKVIQLDTAKEDVVVDRRAVLEEEARAAREKRFAELKEGDTVTGTVRTLTDFGAFIDLGGVDGLLHVTDIAWRRVRKPSDELREGETVEVKILKIDPETRKISLGRKQLTPDPWTLAGEKYKAGQRVTGKVVRLTDFGAFVELEPGLDGMIHISEMSWSKKVRKPADVLKKGETVETVVLAVDPDKRRVALGLKQALGDPREEAPKKFPVGSVVEGTVVSLAKFGAFVELAEGVDGMIHIGDITHEKRLDHPKEALSVGQRVKAVVLELDPERRRIRLGMKQLEPTSADEYIAEHKVGDVVTGRVMESGRKFAKVELADGVVAVCRPAKAAAGEESGKAAEAKPDLSALTAMLAAKWKAGSVPAASGPAGLRPGEVRSFRIVSLDAGKKKIELEPAD